MKRAKRMGLHPRHDLSNPTRRCVEATIRQGLSRITAPRRRAVPSPHRVTESGPSDLDLLQLAQGFCPWCTLLSTSQLSNRDRGSGHRPTGSAAEGFPCRRLRSPAGTQLGTRLGALTGLK